LHRKFCEKPNGRRFIKAFGGDKFEVESAGVVSNFVRPLAIKAM
jgi:hypothetical protein